MGWYLPSPTASTPEEDPSTNSILGGKSLLKASRSFAGLYEVSSVKREEGSREAWLTVAGSFLVYYSSYGIINSFGFFQDFYQTDYLTTASPSTISIIGSLQIALMNVLSTLSGGVCDAHGIKVGRCSYD